MSEYFVASMHAAFLAIGLVMPLGMQNIFIFNQGASHKNFHGALPSIITASFCDALLISLAVLGVSLLILKHIWIELIIFAVGFCFLIYMGFATWQSVGNDFSKESKAFSPKKQVLFALSVQLPASLCLLSGLFRSPMPATVYIRLIRVAFGLKT